MNNNEEQVNGAPVDNVAEALLEPAPAPAGRWLEFQVLGATFVRNDPTDATYLQYINDEDESDDESDEELGWWVSEGPNPADPPPEDYGNSAEDIAEIQATARRVFFEEAVQRSIPIDSECSSVIGDDIDEELQCALCASGRESAMRFGQCSHGCCKGCLKNLWWARVGCESHFPSYIVCPYCRAEVTQVGPDGEPLALLEWMKLNSSRMHQKLLSASAGRVDNVLENMEEVMVVSRYDGEADGEESDEESDAETDSDFYIEEGEEDEDEEWSGEGLSAQDMDLSY